MWETVVQAEIPPHALARVTSYDWLLSLAATPVGYALAPLGASLWSAETPLVAAAIIVALACLGTAAVPGVRRIGGSLGGGRRPPGSTPEREAEPVSTAAGTGGA
ncbi:hypothetical protein AB0J90_31935 [Micromonospora sp. NPDC049523]|uniref:hypothetical protein n=1 Tax=Micromonospora sp. NPDC049523 TaxID=3155921 RepID=UPI003413BEBF